MIRVKIELWLWLGRELGGDFCSPSEMRSEMVVDLPDATTVLAMFDRLATDYPAFGAKVFDREKRKCYQNLMVTRNDRVFNQADSYDQFLQDGDKVMVMPLYAGG
jgi:molybdopterin converting factor small subunit